MSKDLKTNILLIVLDTLRADRINGERKTSVMPNIEKLMSDGVTFTQATCSVHSTITSLGSLFSSKWPFKTGLSKEQYNEINFSVDDYLEIISQNHYNTYSVIPKVISNLPFFKNIQNNVTYPSQQKLGEGLGGKILEIFNILDKKEPWFCYIHLNDLHSPVIAPRMMDNKKFGKNQYDRTLSYIDLWIGKFLDKINTDNTLVVLTSDHGQNKTIAEFEPTKIQKLYWRIDRKIPDIIMSYKTSIIEYIKKKKKQKQLKKLDTENHTIEQTQTKIDSEKKEIFDVFDDVIRIPLIFRGTNLPKNKKYKQLVNHIDVFPTIEKLLGFGKKMNDVDGQSLTKIITDNNFDERLVYIESPPRRKSLGVHVIGIRTSTFKYFRDKYDSKKNIHLYDLKKDPNETVNIANESSTIVKDMEKKLESMLTNNEESSNTMEDDDVKKVEKELRKLGYL